MVTSLVVNAFANRNLQETPAKRKNRSVKILTVLAKVIINQIRLALVGTGLTLKSMVNAANVTKINVQVEDLILATEMVIVNVNMISLEKLK